MAGRIAAVIIACVTTHAAGLSVTARPLLLRPITHAATWSMSDSRRTTDEFRQTYSLAKNSPTTPPARAIDEAGSSGSSLTANGSGALTTTTLALGVGSVALFGSGLVLVGGGLLLLCGATLAAVAWWQMRTAAATAGEQAAGANELGDS